MMKKNRVAAVTAGYLWCILTFASANTTEMTKMINRLAPQHATEFIFAQQPNDSDYFELKQSGKKILIQGNSVNSMAAGLNYYFQNYCHTYVSWYAADPIQLPAVLPAITKPIRKTARVKNRFFLNYCTFGYTMPWWKWSDWERAIDWMALHGINMPLAITGQEAIWQKVWRNFGIADTTIRSYFSGPAYLPWHRMSNLDYWDGPLPQTWIDGQLLLQKRILKRERDLGMTPILPAFAGHVPRALKDMEPKAKIDKLGYWGGFEDKYRSYFLDPLDPLFPKIQKAFLEEQTRQFGTNHIYGADPFNEVDPPSWEPDYLATVARTIYHSMSQVDPKASWLQMTWLFYFQRNKWTNERIKAMVRAVPQDKMTLLDYYCENTEVWRMTESYFGQPFIWCYLGNFGGNTMLAGNLKEVGKRIENTFLQSGKGFSGIGSTLEAFDVNPLMYEFVFDHVWQAHINADEWINKWADLRYGSANDHVREAWQILLNKVYQRPAHLGQATLTNARPSLKGNGNWTTNPNYNYDNRDLLRVWQLMLNAPASTRQSYAFDVVNIGRQVLGNYFMTLRKEFTTCYEQKKTDSLKIKGLEMLDLLNDMDRLLQTESSFLLGKWIADARTIGKTAKEKDYFEQDARNILTTWGTKGQSLNDYASRSWAGLTSSYYAERWKRFINAVEDAAVNKQMFDEKDFRNKITQFEWQWVHKKQSFTTKPQGDPIKTAGELLRKYKKLIHTK